MLSPVTRFATTGKRFVSGIGFYYRKLPGTSKVSVRDFVLGCAAVPGDSVWSCGASEQSTSSRWAG